MVNGAYPIPEPTLLVSGKLDLSEHDFVVSSHGLPPGQKAERPEDNARCFAEDYRGGLLAGYRGTWVAYQHGFICGQSSNSELLQRSAARVHGASSLVLFLVPEHEGGLEGSIEGAITSGVLRIPRGSYDTEVH